ncbi:MAG: DNA repair protein RecN [Bacteroidetes bacterium]|nr:MAG: DNA repair protein RecN [Bacteroidota bacterium]
MLKSLYIKNYALINELNVEFDKGLTIFTGETGAGKSIIIDALSMILGERADSNVVRKGSDKAVVEGIFDIQQLQKIKNFLLEHEFENSDALILRREISLKSQSRCFINDSPATMSILKQVGDMLVDLHGQHEHQSLLRTETHIEMLDDYCGLHSNLEEFGKAFSQASSLLNEKKELFAKKQQLEEKRALFEFQVHEINAVNPLVGEEEQLERERNILENSERLALESNQVYELLYDGEQSANDTLGQIAKHVDLLRTIDDSFNAAGKEVESARSIIDELATFVREYRAKIEFKPERLEEIRIRLGQISLLKKKYGGTLESVIQHREKAEKELALAENFEAEIARLDKDLSGAKALCSELAQQLSKRREEGAKKLNKSVIQTLGKLGIQSARFETKISRQEVAQADHAFVTIGKQQFRSSSKGIDDVEFFISTNVGESPKPLSKVASGGEISRVMLSLKMDLAGKDDVPLLIFDEIDVGISGRIAQSVGTAMKELAKRHQVIAITHLPQIAGFADTHYVVEKIEDDKRATTRVRTLNKKERITEVARLMSGEEVTDAGLQSAKELIEYSVN